MDAALQMNSECNRKFQTSTSRRRSSTWGPDTACLAVSCPTKARRTNCRLRTRFPGHTVSTVSARATNTSGRIGPLQIPAVQQGLILILGYSGFLGNANNTGAPFDLGCLFCVKSTSGSPNAAGVLHFYQLKNTNTYVLDDWKVSSRLTINIGLRWEYDGQLTDKYGHLTQVWLDRMASNAQIAACTHPATHESGVRRRRRSAIRGAQQLS